MTAAMTLIIPVPTVVPPGRDWNGKPRRERTFRWSLGPAESGGKRVLAKRVLDLTCTHWPKHKAFAALLTPKTVRDSIETWDQLRAVRVEPVVRCNRYTDRQLDEYARQMLDSLPVFAEDQPDVRALLLTIPGVAPQVDDGAETVPFHYRDHDGTPCPTSGSPGWAEGQACPEGHDSARGHYANDGHPECDDDDLAALQPTFA